MDMSKKDNDGLDGSYVIGADPDLKIFNQTKFDNVPNKPFTWLFFAKSGLDRRTIGDHLRRLERLGVLKGEIKIVKSIKSGVACRMRVYQKI